jgi:hypothetical protein
MTHLLFVDEEAGTKPPKKQIDGKPTPMTAGLLLDYERSAQAARGVPRHAEQKQHGHRNGVTKWAGCTSRGAGPEIGSRGRRGGSISSSPRMNDGRAFLVRSTARPAGTRARWAPPGPVPVPQPPPPVCVATGTRAHAPDF